MKNIESLHLLLTLFHPLQLPEGLQNIYYKIDRKFLFFFCKKIFCNLTSILLKLKVRIFGIVKFVRYALNIIKFYFTKNDLEMFWKFNITIQMLGFFYSYSVFINGVQILVQNKKILDSLKRSWKTDNKR